MERMVNGKHIQFGVDHVAAKIDEYFELCKETKTKPRLTRLALHIGFSSLRLYNEYMRYPEFTQMLEWAKLTVAAAYEEGLDDRQTFAGSQFWLRTQQGWLEKQLVDITSSQVNIDGGNLTDAVKAMSDEELLRRLNMLQEKSDEDDETN